MTAVEWLYERLERMIPRNELYNGDKIRYFEQAIEMEKQQIIDSVLHGMKKGLDINKIPETDGDWVNNYYREQLKNK